jgi:hypothetical protein
MQSSYRSYVEQRRLIWAFWNDGKDERGRLRDSGAKGPPTARERIIQYFATQDGSECPTIQRALQDTRAVGQWQSYQDRLAAYTNQTVPDKAKIAFTEAHPSQSYNQDELGICRALQSSVGKRIDPPGKSKHGQGRAFDVGLSADRARAALWCAAGLAPDQAKSFDDLGPDEILLQFLILEKSNNCLHVQLAE